MIRLRFGTGTEQIDVELSLSEARVLQQHLATAVATPALSPLDPGATARAVEAASLEAAK